MQTLTEIRQMLEQAGLRPQKAFGQCFLVDHNMLAKLIELADIPAGIDETATGLTVLEVGAGTGTLTEELLDRGIGVLAAEIDRGLCRLLRERLGGRPGFSLIEGDVLAGKHEIAPTVLAALGQRTQLVSNLPYNIATPLLAECLTTSWRHQCRPGPGWRLFEHLTFTVQREVADRLAASPGTNAYGPVSVIVAAMGTITPGPVVSPGAFWPRPNVASRMCRIDFDPARAKKLRSVEVLQELLAQAFGQRRKQIRSLCRRKGFSFGPDAVEAAMAAGGIDPSVRPEMVGPDAFVAFANCLSEMVE